MVELLSTQKTEEYLHFHQNYEYQELQEIQ